jgi:serine/threonine protein kinase
MDDSHLVSGHAATCAFCGDSLRPEDQFCQGCGAAAGEQPGTVGWEDGADPDVTWVGVLETLQTATLGEFQIIRELGHGGMGAVYLAHDIHLDKKVAIKVMSPALASDTRMVERFRREARTVAALSHPNIAAVHRVLNAGGLQFFVMDFIRGRPLQSILRTGGALSIPITRGLLYMVGSALNFAHRRKIYHRDIKPANILVSALDGNAFVTDFGIAKVAERPGQTATGAIMGTPEYMAPEQILGTEISGAADQYALGIVAYQLLTGEPPFGGTMYAVMHAHMEEPPRAIRAARPECPPDLEAAVLRMLAKKPDDRWPTIQDALVGLGATSLGEDDPVRAELAVLARPRGREARLQETNTPQSPIATSREPNRGSTVAMIGISPPPEHIAVGDELRLVADARTTLGARVEGAAVTWTSTDPNVVAVDARGAIRAVGPGSAEISASAGRARGAIVVSVVPAGAETVDDRTRAFVPPVVPGRTPTSIPPLQAQATPIPAHRPPDLDVPLSRTRPMVAPRASVAPRRSRRPALIAASIVVVVVAAGVVWRGTHPSSTGERNNGVPVVPLGPDSQATRDARSAAETKHDPAPLTRAESTSTKPPSLVVADRGRQGRAATGPGTGAVPPKRDDGRAEASKPAITQTGGAQTGGAQTGGAQTAGTTPAVTNRDSGVSRGNATGGSAVGPGPGRSDPPPPANPGGATSQNTELQRFAGLVRAGDRNAVSRFLETGERTRFLGSLDGHPELATTVRIVVSYGADSADFFLMVQDSRTHTMLPVTAEYRARFNVVPGGVKLFEVSKR